MSTNLFQSTIFHSLPQKYLNELLYFKKISDTVDFNWVQTQGLTISLSFKPAFKFT